MESKGGKKSSSSSLMYEAPLGYSIEDVRPAGGAKKFSAAYSNVRRKHTALLMFQHLIYLSFSVDVLLTMCKLFLLLQCAKKPS
jgi:S-adenosylmethionine decarboxylase